ncbi:MAG TPA: glycerophosphodiester phosphodiesterase [Bryobacteraceae bacterium]|nr:glycerophosphodiester phosphodiesterase [Bryobacteraceae bacterium]
MRTILGLLVLSITALPASRVLVHGHRGARAVLPENTIPAFEYAIQAGVDVLELDVSVTRDKVLVVSHDPALDSSICTGWPHRTPIRLLSLAQLQKVDCGSLKNPEFPKQKPVPGARIPTLDEVFALAKRGDFEFNVETKIFAKYPFLTPGPGEFARMLYDAIRKHGLEQRVIVQSFDFRTLHAMKKLNPKIRLSALYDGAPRSFIAIAKEAGAQIVSPEHRLVTKEQVDAAHKAGLQVVAWTTNAPADWKRLVECGVDAIISDDPAELLAFLGRARSR